ncbi:hypothetical protein GQ53DRAFT_820113 [Thozetella sp. PMI_491]|nr:hypothetical protein GQ53DRAFT_820113 [Thozetella sp. PMI_491]
MASNSSAVDPAALALIYPMPTGDPSVTSKVLASIWIMFTISTIFLGLRVYCRSIRTKTMWWDDYLLITGWVLMLVAVALQTEIFRDGYLVTALSGPIISPANLASDSVMKISLAFSKTSFSVMLLRVTKKGWVPWVIYACTAIMDIACLVHAVLTWRASCGVPAASFNWQPCWSTDSGIWMNMIGAIISAVTDFILALVPIYVVWGLQMPRREKYGVAVAMGIGILAGAVAVLRAVEANQVTKVVGPAFSYRLADLSIWIHAEADAALVACSIPALRVLFRDFKKYFTTSSRSRSNGQQYIRSNQQSKFHGGMNSSIAGATTVKPDNDSETSILSDKNGIRQTRHVIIEYDTPNHHKYGEQGIELESQRKPPSRRP